MHKIMKFTVAAFAGIAFSGVAQAEGGCEWLDRIATTPKPAVTADSGKTTTPSPVATPTKKDG